MKCSNCLQIGHNKLTCKNETVLKNVEPPKPRGRPKKPPVPTFFERPKNITRGSKKKKKRTDFGFGIYTDPITGDTYLNRQCIICSGDSLYQIVEVGQHPVKVGQVLNKQLMEVGQMLHLLTVEVGQVQTLMRANRLTWMHHRFNHVKHVHPDHHKKGWIGP